MAFEQPKSLMDHSFFESEKGNMYQNFIFDVVMCF